MCGPQCRIDPTIHSIVGSIPAQSSIAFYKAFDWYKGTTIASIVGPLMQTLNR